MLSSIELSVLVHRTFTLPDVYDQHGDQVVCLNMRDWLELRAEVLRMRRDGAADSALGDKIAELEAEVARLDDRLAGAVPASALTPLILL